MYVELQDRSIRVRWRPGPAGADSATFPPHLVDLGMSPLCASYVPEERLGAMEPFPYKHGQFLPGTHLPIKHPEVREEDRPGYIPILIWNLEENCGAARLRA